MRQFYRAVIRKSSWDAGVLFSFTIISFAVTFSVEPALGFSISLGPLSLFINYRGKNAK